MSTAGPTHVVSCFLLRVDRGRDEFLLVRRSERVRTYRGRWAAISGYLEVGATPEEQAYTELREETTLLAADVALARVGEPLPVHDAAERLEWLVHPFLFHALRPEAVHTDWEAHESRWVPPAEIGQLATVPGLVQALARVYGDNAILPAVPDGA